MNAKLISIGNSKGVRLPKRLIEKYHLHDTLELEEKKEGILIKTDMPEDKLSFEETFREMAAEEEDWTDFETVTDDGIH